MGGMAGMILFRIFFFLCTEVPLHIGVTEAGTAFQGIIKSACGLGVLLEELREDDLLILTADHGNDPTYSGTDHTREYVPFLAYSKTMKEGGTLENEDTFSIIGASVADNFEVKMPEGTIGHSIFEKLC